MSHVMLDVVKKKKMKKKKKMREKMKTMTQVIQVTEVSVNFTVLHVTRQ